MSSKNSRVEIPRDCATEVLFASDRTCCVCRGPKKPVQLHHLDEDPSNSVEENLAVLCLECHNDTMVRGGFGRKLGAPLITKYKADWLRQVAERRGGLPRQAVTANNQGRSLNFVQMIERDEEHRYDFAAEYVLMTSADPSVDAEVGLCTASLITRELQRFRMHSYERSEYKQSLLAKFPDDPEMHRPDVLSFTHDVSLFNESFLSVRYDGLRYQAGTGRPLTFVRTLNLQLKPCLELEPAYLFKFNSKHFEYISDYCIQEIRSRISEKRNGRADLPLDQFSEDWLVRGASSETFNTRPFLIKREGIIFIFELYTVSCRADGTFEVVIPWHRLRDYVSEHTRRLLGWVS